METGANRKVSNCDFSKTVPTFSPQVENYVENANYRSVTEVKQRCARSIFGWEADGKPGSDDTLSSLLH
jgi:hypothetical protein